MGCGPTGTDLPPVPTAASIVGAYSLKIVNGGGLPYPVAADPDRTLYIASGVITLNPDLTFTDVLTSRLTYNAGSPPPQDLVKADSGTYLLYGRNVAMMYRTVTGTDTVAVTGNSLQKLQSSLVLTYTK